MSRELDFEDKLFRSGLHIKTRGEIRRVLIRRGEQKRASAARSLEAAIAIGADVYRRSGDEDDAARLAVLVGTHADLTGKPLSSVKALFAGKSAQLSAVAHKSLEFLDG